LKIYICFFNFFFQLIHGLYIWSLV
jgi:hypothetical protein